MQRPLIAAVLAASALFSSSQAQAQEPSWLDSNRRLGVGFSAGVLTYYVPDTDYLALSAKYSFSPQIALQGHLGVCPFVSATTCLGADVLFEGLLKEDLALVVNGYVGLGAALGVSFSSDPLIQVDGPELKAASAFFGISMKPRLQPVEVFAEWGPSLMTAGSFTGVTSRISAGVRYYF